MRKPCIDDNMTDHQTTLGSSFLSESIHDPKSLVALRSNLLGNEGPGLALVCLDLIRRTVDSWLERLRTPRRNIDNLPLSKEDQTIATHRVLVQCRTICTLDPCLNEELGREGLHPILTKIMNLDHTMFETEEDQDTIMEVQDLACEIASIAISFPMKVAPFSRLELLDRLPLIFPIGPVLLEDDHDASRKDQEAVTILINQVKERQSSQADVGFIMWPSAVVLSRYLVTNPQELLNKDVLEIGCGCGLSGLVAGQIKAAQGGDKITTVYLTDFNATVVKNCEGNIALNGLQDIVKSEQLDFYQQDIAVDGWVDSTGVKHEQVDLILAADVICQPEDAFAAARTIFCALKSGGRAIVVSADSKHRFGIEKFEEACQLVKLQITLSTNVRDIYNGQLLCHDIEKTTGYVENMSLIMFIIEKP